MIKKILFLLTFLLTTLGGGNLAWAQTTYVLQKSTYDHSSTSDPNTTWHFSNGLTISNSKGKTWQDNNNYIKLSSGTQYTIAGIPPTQTITSVTFEGFRHYPEETGNFYIKEFNGALYSHDTSSGNDFNTATSSDNIGSVSFSELSITSESFTFTPQGALDFIITITTEEKTIDNVFNDTYPYTWDFTVEDAKWTKSKSQMNSLGWNFIDTDDPAGENYDEARPNAPSNMSYNIDIIEGLHFKTLDAGSLCLDWKNKWMWLNGTVTLPALKKGHKVTIVSEAAPESFPANLTESTSGNTRQYLATEDIATPAFNFDGKVISSIAVTKSDFTMSLNSTDLTKYAEINGGGESKNKDTDPGSLANYSSILYDDAHPYIRMKLNLDKYVQSDIGVAKTDYPTYFKVTNSSDETVIDITNCYTSQVGADDEQSKNGKGNRVYIYNVKMLKAGTSNLTFKFVGGDAFGYNENEITVPVVIIKGTQTLSFAAPTTTVDYGQNVPENALTQTPATGGGEVSYISSNTHVATVAADGTVTGHNAGSCTITATAAENDKYYSATASYTLTVKGTQNPTIAWNASNNFTQSGDIWTANDLPYGNHKKYEAHVSNADGSGVKDSDIRYGLVDGSEGYLTIDTNTGQINPTRRFADENSTEKVVEVYAYIPADGSHNAAPRITYQVKIVKGTFSDDLFKENDLYVNVGHTIAPKNNLQSMRWEDIDNITVSIQTGDDAVAVSGDGDNMVEDYKTASPRATYFDIKTPTSGDNAGHEVVDWFYPIFKGKTTGVVTFTVTLKSKLYGDKSGVFTLHVIESSANTPLAWASGVKTGHGENDGYTIYEGDYMLIPAITGNCNGNFQYSDGYKNANTYHKYLYTRRWASSAYEFVYNNRNYKKGQGVPNYELCSDAAGTTVFDPTTAGNEVALLFWNVGGSNDTDELLIYGNKAGTIYLRAKDSQVDRQLETIKITVKSRNTIDSDFDAVTSAMTFPYTWDFTAESFAGPDQTDNGYWTVDNGKYSLDMQSCFNYDYADYDKDGITWSNTGAANTSSSELTDKPLVSSFSSDKVMRGFSGMKIRLGNNGTGSWFSKRDGIHILSYSNSNPGAPRLRVTTGTHTLILPKPTGENCPATFKVFVKVKALEAGEGTLWVRNASLARDAKGQNKYHDFKSTSAGEDIIYSVNASKDQSLELDLDKVDVYWIAYSTEAKNIPKHNTNEFLTYAAASYSYNADLDISKSLDANDGVIAYYASGFIKDDKGISAGSDNSGDDEGDYAVKMSPLNGAVPANTGILLKKASPDDCYMIVNAKNMKSEQYSDPDALSTNYLKGTGSGVSVSRTTTIGDDTYSNFAISHAYKYYKDITDPSTVQGGYRFDRDWSFYPIMGNNANIAAQKAYLQIPGNLYVNKNGEIVDLPASSRASWRAADDDDAPVAPASKAALSIVFEDELPLSPENPDVTGVFDIERHADDNIINNGVWYNMEGMRISTPTKPGLYIRNGKKVFIK